jgi:hypothetical protein
MTRKPTRNYSLSVVVPFIAILTLLIAAAVLAQVPSADRPSGKANAVLVPAGAAAPAQAERPLTPWTDGAGRFPVSRSHKNKPSAVPLDGYPLQFLPPVIYDSGAPDTTWLAVGDLNGDGHPDVVMTVCSDPCSGSSRVAVLLGNGDGTFQAPVTYGSGGWNPWSVAIADVNGDGKPDLVVANFGGTVGVLLGNGDGTFQPPVSYKSGGEAAFSVAIGDLRGNGHMDLVVANWCASGNSCNNGVLGVLLGNGDGTFQAPVAYSSGGYQSYSVAIGDLNEDGKPDLVATNQCQSGGNCSEGTLSVLLGNGDGTFQAPVSYNDGMPGTSSVALGDVNGDGHLDLVAASDRLCSTCSDGGVSVLLGNGDGTFQAPLTYDSGGEKGFSVAIGDLNGDGYPDLVVTNTNSNSVGVLLGNGNGTFQPVITYDSGGAWDFSVAVADVNGDGKLDLVVANEAYPSGTGDGVLGVLLNDSPYTPAASTTTLTSSPNPSSSTQVVTFTASVSAEAGTPTGTVEFFDGNVALGSATLTSGNALFPVSWLAAGSHSITAKYQGDGRYRGSASAPLNQVVNRLTTTTSLVSSQNPAVVTEYVTYTATIASQYGGAVTGTVVFQDGGSTIATVTIVGNRAAYSTKYSSPGTHSITATYSGDANHAGSVSATLVEQINQGFLSKTVLATSGSPTFVGQPVTFTATVTSTQGIIPDGEVVTFYDGTTAIGTRVTASGVATFVTSSLAGKAHIIKAAYGGDATFEPSLGSVKQVVDKYTTTTALSSGLNPSNYGQRVTLMATVTSAGPAPTGTVIFKSGSVTLGGGTLNASGVATLTTAKIPVGADTLTATYNGDASNAKSVSAAITQTVRQASISMVLTSYPNPSTFGKSVKFTAKLTSNGGLPSGQPVTFSYNGATLGTANVNSVGVATFYTTALPRGSDVVTAAYAGTVDYSAASATVTQVVH